MWRASATDLQRDTRAPNTALSGRPRAAAYWPGRETEKSDWQARGEAADIYNLLLGAAGALILVSGLAGLIQY